MSKMTYIGGTEIHTGCGTHHSFGQGVSLHVLNIDFISLTWDSGCSAVTGGDTMLIVGRLTGVVDLEPVYRCFSGVTPAMPTRAGCLHDP